MEGKRESPGIALSERAKVSSLQFLPFERKLYFLGIAPEFKNCLKTVGAQQV